MLGAFLTKTQCKIQSRVNGNRGIVRLQCDAACVGSKDASGGEDIKFAPTEYKFVEIILKNKKVSKNYALVK